MFYASVGLQTRPVNKLAEHTADPFLRGAERVEGGTAHGEKKVLAKTQRRKRKGTQRSKASTQVKR